MSNTFSGVWSCKYWYPSNEFVGDEPSHYKMKATQAGNDVVFESLPSDDKAYMLVRLTIQDNIAIGGWHETTSPTGKFKGAMYNGTGQLLLDAEMTSMEGKWVGAGYDHKLKEMRIYSGNWELMRLGDK